MSDYPERQTPFFSRSMTPLQIYDPAQVIPVLDRLVPNWQDRQRLDPNNLNSAERSILRIGHRMLNESPIRFLRKAMIDRWRVLEPMLLRQFPHFGEVTALVRQAIFLSHRSGSQLQIPPMLLLGDPGLGKTYYASMLAKHLGLDFESWNLASTTAGFILSGMDSGWSEAKPGAVFHQMLNGSSANPLFLLDEIDKASGLGGSRHDTLGPLYGLLEPHSAKAFRDEFFPISLDCSQVQWIATANDLSGIPDPIRSRMRVITVPYPTVEQRREIVRIIYSTLLADRPWGRIFDGDIPQRLVHEIADRCRTPREIRRELEDVCGAAAVRQKEWPSFTDLSDAHAELQPDVVDLAKRVPEGVPFGFAAGGRSEPQGSKFARRP